MKPKLKLILADNDAAYLERLTKYIQKKGIQFDLASFSSKDILEQYLDNSKSDILLCSSDLFSDKVRTSGNGVKMILSDGTYDSNDEYIHINKYQKAENLITSILIEYAEITGRTGSVAGQHIDTKIVGVYSPVGGCGKTTLALVLGRALSEKGKKVFYLNYECISSTADFMQSNTGMSDVYLAAVSRNGNAGLKVTSNKVNDPVTGVSYVGCPESMMEFNELTAEQLCRIINQTDEMNEFDNIIVDFDSALSNDKLTLLSVCNKIIMPFTNTSASVVKIKYFLRESKMHPELEDIISRTIPVINRNNLSEADTIKNFPFEFSCMVYSIPELSAFHNFKNIPNGNCSKIMAGIMEQIM